MRSFVGFAFIDDLRQQSFVVDLWSGSHQQREATCLRALTANETMKQTASPYVLQTPDQLGLATFPHHSVPGGGGARISNDSIITYRLAMGIVDSKLARSILLDRLLDF